MQRSLGNKTKRVFAGVLSAARKHTRAIRRWQASNSRKTISRGEKIMRDYWDDDTENDFEEWGNEQLTQCGVLEALKKESKRCSKQCNALLSRIQHLDQLINILEESND